MQHIYLPSRVPGALLTRTDVNLNTWGGVAGTVGAPAVPGSTPFGSELWEFGAGSPRGGAGGAKQSLCTNWDGVAQYHDMSRDHEGLTHTHSLLCSELPQTDMWKKMPG